MIYTAHTIDEIDDQNYVVVGELDIGGTARPLTLPLELTGVERDQTGALRAGLEGTRRITRKEWGISWNTPLDSGGCWSATKSRSNLNYH